MKKQFYFFTKYVTQGFTLLETLASVTILTFIVIGPLAVIISSSSYARQTKDTMVATYLAEEAIELLQNHYDSLYVFCKKQPSDPLCTPLVSLPNETSGQIAWRVFKQRMGTGGGTSCYLSENSDGCSFDYLDMTAPITYMPPVRYAANATDCSSLTSVETIPSSNQGGQLSGVSFFTYACKGVLSHVTGTVTGNPFTRSVIMESLPTFESGSFYDQYNDDVRITSEVTFKGYNGLTQRVKIVRFLHARS